ncbi:two-component system osmolarity sensor histidine kinase EnvZ [Candidatus Pelagibacter ubique]|uniref:histidine kinase n=1 Tax=Pelagibacter ubique TaxID=198252 RepID=A0ABX1T0B9_PELUQ|nr:ATP-binding protein [Candidatus Pelagibacter ubique]NMN67553.1 two-component system osmolarity sensor histidine kinase EnvZ [Candidatus Pelagibacter ubique]
MSYGLSKFIKNLLPKRLFYRALLIVAVPIIVLQLIITVVFFDSLWIKTNKGMTRALVGEMKTFIVAHENGKYNNNDLSGLFSIYLDLNVEYKGYQLLDKPLKDRWFSPIDRTLRRELKSNIGAGKYWFDTTSYKELIHINIKQNDGYFEFFIPKDRVASTSARMFALWITLPALLMITIAIIFLKNQTRPIVNLAKAAAKFGRGENIDEYRPSGALEIRQAGLEFDKMRKRIMRHLTQRSEMLSGISHDLRTPLTRLKLQLSFIKNEEQSKKMSLDIDEMEKMLNEYLQFTSSTYLEKNEDFDISELIKNTIDKYDNSNISKVIIPRVYMNGRKNLIQRSLNNIIDNSIKHANKISVELSKKNNNIIIIVDDDGLGIPENEYQNVFKPFYKLDKSRGNSKSSVGLGLSITSDIIKSHGGNIILEKSPLNGLRVKVFLPL